MCLPFTCIDFLPQSFLGLATWTPPPCACFFLPDHPPLPRLHTPINHPSTNKPQPTADIGILSAYATPTTPQMLTRSGLTHLTTSHLSKILEAAFYKSRRQLAGKETTPEDAIMVTGLEMWEDTSSSEGKENSGNNGPVYWRGCPEFSHLATYNSPSNSSSSGKQEVALKDRIRDILATAPSIPKDDKTQKGIPAKRGLEEKRKEVQDLLTTAFLAFLSRTLGFATETFEMGIALGMYGLDSLSAVSVQYWVWRGGCFTVFLLCCPCFLSLLSITFVFLSDLRLLESFQYLHILSCSYPVYYHWRLK